MSEHPSAPHCDEEPWQRFLRLLAPFHAAAAMTARRLERSPHDGDDLFHDAVMRAFDKLPLLRDEASFRGWFYAVMLSVHRTRTRRGFWKRFRSLDRQCESGWDMADGSAASPDRAAAQRAATAVATLPAVQREAVVLFDIEGFSLQEVAEFQSASLSAVKTRLGRGREKLRALYLARGWAPASADPSALAGAAVFAGDTPPLTEGSAS